METTYKDQWIWITGASAGLGRAMAKGFADLGANLILSARNVEKLESVKQECGGSGQKHILPLNLANQDELPSLVDQALGFGGQIDVLINNGGVSQRSTALDTQLAVSKRLFDINFFGTIALTQLVLPSMIKRKIGQVVVVSSIVGKFGSPLRSSYAASKHAIQGYFDSLRFEVQNHGIDVTILCPGFIHTDVSKNALTGDGKPQTTMDQKTSKGMSTEVFAKKALRIIRRRKKEGYIGKYEILGVYIKRFFPNLFHRIISNSKVT